MLLLASLSLGSFSLSSCTGTGGSAYSGGAIYNPDGTIAGVSGSDSSSNSTGGGVQGNGTMSAADILKFTQSNRTDEIVSILSEHGLPEETDNGPGFFTITLPAASIDLPDDGYATLQVLGGVEDYDGFSFVEDGNVCFRNIRMVPVGAEITIHLRCYSADGALIASADDTGVAQEDGLQFNISVLGQAVIVLGDNGEANGITTVKDGKTYEVIEYTGSSLGMSVLNTNSNSTMEVTVNGSTVSPSCTLSDGYNAIFATVTKDGNGAPIETEKNIYVVKALSEDDIAVSYPGGTETAADSGIWQYRYSQVDNLKLTVENNYSGDDANTGAHSSIKVEVDSTVTTWTGGTSVTSTPHVEYTDDSKVEDKDLQDGTHTITITLSKPLCTDVQVVKSITSAIKPIKVWIRDGSTHIKFEESGDLTMRGTLHIGVNPHGQYAYDHRIGVNTSDGCTWLEIRNLANGGDWDGDVTDTGATDRNGDIWINNKDDKLCYKTNDLHRANGNPFKGIIKVDFEPNLKLTQYDLSVSVWTDDSSNDCPQRVGNGANSIHTIYLGLDDGY